VPAIREILHELHEANLNPDDRAALATVSTNWEDLEESLWREQPSG